MWVLWIVNVFTAIENFVTHVIIGGLITVLKVEQLEKKLCIQVMKNSINKIIEFIKT
jgi:hypothetical protein